MSTDFWHYHGDFQTTPPRELVKRFWLDDELNRQRSVETFKVEAEFVDEGLEIYLAAIQGAMSERPVLDGDDRLRASVAMLIHALNTFLVWRHLLSHGYIAESRLFARSIHESITQALAFANDDALAKRFYEGKQISPRNIQKKLSLLLPNESPHRQEVFNRISNQYQRLSTGSHPTLDSFSLRTASLEPGNAGLRKAVPEAVVIGGLLSDDLGRVSWLGLARNIANALASVGHILIDASGNWATRTEEYQARIDKIVQEHEIWLDEHYPK